MDHTVESYAANTLKQFIRTKQYMILEEVAII